MPNTTFRIFARAPLLAAALFCGLSTLVSAAEEGKTLYETQYQGLAMGTLITARLISPDAKVAQKLEELVSERVDDYETLFTVHREGPLYEVNKRSGEWVEVDCRITELTEKAKAIAEASDRAFEPTIGTLVNVWKIGFGGDQVPARRDIDADRPVYQLMTWVLWNIKTITKDYVEFELRNPMDGNNFYIPARQYIPPEFTLVTLG